MPLNDRLFALLRKCRPEQLVALWTVDLERKASDKGFDKADPETRQMLVSAEIRSAAGHTLRNVRRGAHDLEWTDVLRLVATGIAAETEAGVEMLKDDVERPSIGKARVRMERLVVALAEARIEAYLQEHDASPEGTPADGPALDIRLRLEDAALRTVSPSSDDVESIGPYVDMAAKGIIVAAPLAVRFLGGGALLALGAMRPAYRKVVPAVVRLLHIGAVAPTQTSNA